MSPVAAPARLNHAQIAARVPHTGSMCLLDQVLAWDATQIQCTAISHRDAHNPLRFNGLLPSLTAIEYAAQAMAVHGSLINQNVAENETPPQGRLVSARNFESFCDDLSLLEADLSIDCTLLLGDAQSSTFAFTVRAGALLVAQGRASVMLVKI